MPFIPVPNVGEFSVIQDLKGQAVVNVYHIKKEGGWDSASLAAMAVVLISWYNDDFAPNTSSDLQFLSVKCRDLTTEAGAVAEVNFPALSGGDNPEDALPSQCSISIAHTTGVAGRSYRGRTSYAGVRASQVADNRFGPVVVGNYVDAADALDAAITAAGGTWGVVSKYHGYTQPPPKYKKIPTPRAEGIFTDIINNSCTGRVGSQDSRNN